MCAGPCLKNLKKRASLRWVTGRLCFRHFLGSMRATVTICVMGLHDWIYEQRKVPEEDTSQEKLLQARSRLPIRNTYLYGTEALKEGLPMPRKSRKA
jgi:hypothetical protein